MFTNDFETTSCFIGKYNLSIHSLILDESSQSYVYTDSCFFFFLFLVAQMVIYLSVPLIVGIDLSTH